MLTTNGGSGGDNRSVGVSPGQIEEAEGKVFLNVFCCWFCCCLLGRGRERQHLFILPDSQPLKHQPGR